MTSKIGLHMNSLAGREDEYLAFMAEAQPSHILVLFANAPWLREALAVSPRTTIIQRRYCDKQPLTNPQGEAEDLASKLAASSIYPVVAEHNGYWVGYNEIAGFSHDERRRQAEFEWWMAEYAHRAGVRYAALSVSVGRYHVDLDADDPMYEWRDYYDAIRHADAISAHIYNAPRANDPRDYDRGHWWRIGRPILEHDLFPEDLQDKPWLLTEGIIDSGAAHWDPGGQGGWRSFMTPSQYIEDIQWVEELYRDKPYVECVLLFGWGTEDPTWDTFDPSKPPEMYHLLLNYLKERNRQPGIDDPEFRAWLSERAQRHVIPMTTGTYFRQVQRERGWDEAMSDEFYPSPGVVAQVFYTQSDDMQHIVYAEVGKWAQYRVIERQN